MDQYNFFSSSFNSGITNSLGLFTLYDVTVSADTTFTATYSTVSDSVNVYYATKYDYGTNSNNSNIWTKRSSESTGLERLTDHSRMYELGTVDAYIDTAVTAPCTIEYDFKQTSNFARWAVNVLNSSSNSGFALSESITGTDDWHHIKIEISSTGATFKADNGTTVSKTLENINTFRFRTNNEISELFFKNFVIY